MSPLYCGTFMNVLKYYFSCWVSLMKSIPKVRHVFQFPEELQRLTANLRTVDVSHNKIEELPASIGNFLQMKSLTLNSNKLSKTFYK